MGPYSASYSSPSPYTEWGSLCRNKSSLQEEHVTRTNTRNCMYMGSSPTGQLQAAQAAQRCSLLTSWAAPSLTAVIGTTHRSLSSFFPFPSPQDGFPAFSPPRHHLIDCGSWSSCSLSPSSGRAAVRSREWASEHLLSFFLPIRQLRSNTESKWSLPAGLIYLV